MADIKNAAERSRNMSAIRSCNTKPEIYMRHQLFKRGYRYRVYVSYIPGHPDIFLRKYNTAVFIHGCFWHRHQGCKYTYMPKSRVEFWSKKFQANINRDLRVQEELRSKRIKCLVIWECTIRKMQHNSAEQDVVLQKIDQFFKNAELNMEL